MNSVKKLILLSLKWFYKNNELLILLSLLLIADADTTNQNSKEFYGQIAFVFHFYNS